MRRDLVSKILQNLLQLVPENDAEIASTYASDIKDMLFSKEKTISASKKEMSAELLKNSLGLLLDQVEPKVGKQEVYNFKFPNGIEPLSDWFLQGKKLLEDHIIVDKEASHRLTIDIILMESLKLMPLKPKLKLRTENKFFYETAYYENGQRINISAETDYDIGYNDENASRIFIVEAKAKTRELEGFSSGEIYQLIAQLGIVYSSRKDAQKDHPGVYGALASTFSWQFFKITDTGVVQQSEPYPSNTVEQIQRILFIIGHINQLIVDLTPSLSADNLTATIRETVELSENMIKPEVGHSPTDQIQNLPSELTIKLNFSDTK